MKIILTKGLPGSGKSTWAKEMVKRMPNVYKRVNRDDLREMLSNSIWSKENERFVVLVWKCLIKEALEGGYSVIVDDTNLNPIHEQEVKTIINHHRIRHSKNVELEIQDFTHVPLSECISNDLKRAKSVGERVIRRMYHQYLEKPINDPIFDASLPSAVICDLDGTLALMSNRDPYDASNCEKDTLNIPVYTILKNRQMSDPFMKTILVSGRSDVYENQTVEWLKKNNISWDFLYMRQAGDFRKDAIVKEEIYKSAILGKYNIDFVLDDRDQVVEMWRKQGLTCLQVADGNF